MARNPASARTSASARNALASGVPRLGIGGIFVKNAGFELGTQDSARTTTGWLGGGNYGWYIVRHATAVSAEYDTAEKRSGVASLKLSATDTAGRLQAYNEVAPYRDNMVKVKPSTEYTLNVYAKTTNAATDSVFVTIAEYTPAIGYVTGQTSNKLSGTNDWTLITKTFTSDATTGFISIYLRLDVAGNVSDAWFDDLTLTETGVTRNAVV